MKWASLLLLLMGAHAVTASDDPALIVSGDRVVLLGGTFIERMQIYGHLEAEIISRVPDVKVRNLGWSGDNVWGESRAVFGTIDQGFDRMMRDMRLARPTVIVVCYGANEAHQGRSGLESFEQGLVGLVDALAEFKAKIVLLGPRPYERLGPPLPDPTVFNQHLSEYTERIKNIAAARDLAFIDLGVTSPSVKTGVLQERQPPKWRVLPQHEGLTSNGLHFTANGYRTISAQIAVALALPGNGATISIGQTAQMSGGEMTGYRRRGDEIDFSFRLKHLTLSEGQGDGKYSDSNLTIKASDLGRGKYELTVDDGIARTLTSGQLRVGVVLNSAFAQEQNRQLRYLIVEKNMLFFHRHRPQNETYLFLFRKHEQGNNAVEIPKFDPLIDSVEELINQYAAPKIHQVVIRPEKK